MKTYWGMEDELPAFLTLALDGSEWQSSCSSPFTCGNTALLLCTHWIGGRVGLKVILLTVSQKYRKKICLLVVVCRVMTPCSDLVRYQNFGGS